jgi:hypothetical protein
MASPVSTVVASPDLSLAEINTLIGQQESILGPLVTIGTDGTENLLIFDFNSEPPDRYTFVGTAPPPPGATLVAMGKMFISGQLRDVAAYRAG